MRTYFQSTGKAVDVLKSDVPFAALDLPEVAAIQTTDQCQPLLSDVF